MHIPALTIMIICYADDAVFPSDMILLPLHSMAAGQFSC